MKKSPRKKYLLLSCLPAAVLCVFAHWRWYSRAQCMGDLLLRDISPSAATVSYRTSGPVSETGASFTADPAQAERLLALLRETPVDYIRSGAGTVRGGPGVARIYSLEFWDADGVRSSFELDDAGTVYQDAELYRITAGPADFFTALQAVLSHWDTA